FRSSEPNDEASSAGTSTIAWTAPARGRRRPTETASRSMRPSARSADEEVVNGALRVVDVDAVARARVPARRDRPEDHAARDPRLGHHDRFTEAQRRGLDEREVARRAREVLLVRDLELDVRRSERRRRRIAGRLEESVPLGIGRDPLADRVDAQAEL